MLEEKISKHLIWPTYTPLIVSDITCLSIVSHFTGKTFFSLWEIAKNAISDIALYAGETPEETLSIDTARDIIQRISQTPFGKIYICILCDIHRISLKWANSLLKTFEDTPPHLLFLCTTSKPHLLPITLLSRMQIIDTNPLPSPLSPAYQSAVDDFFTWNHANLVQIILEKKLEKKEILALLDACVSRVRSGQIHDLKTLILLQEGLTKATSTNINSKDILTRIVLSILSSYA